MLEFGSLDNVFHSIDENAEKTEIQERMRGVDTLSQQWENHAVRIKIITDFMMGEHFIKLMKSAQQDPRAAQVVQMFMAHRKQHQDFLSAEMKTMMPAAGAPAQ